MIIYLLHAVEAIQLLDINIKIHLLTKFSSAKFVAGWWQIKEICVLSMGGVILKGESEGRGKNPVTYQFVHHKAHTKWLVMEYEAPKNEIGG